MEAMNVPRAVGSELPSTCSSQPGEQGALAGRLFPKTPLGRGWLLPKTPLGRGHAVQESISAQVQGCEVLALICALPGLLLLPLLTRRRVPGLDHPFAIRLSLIFFLGGGRNSAMAWRSSPSPCIWMPRQPVGRLLAQCGVMNSAL